MMLNHAWNMIGLKYRHSEAVDHISQFAQPVLVYILLFQLNYECHPFHIQKSPDGQPDMCCITQRPEFHMA